MTKKKSALIFTASIVVGVFLSACAGVAAGKFEPGSVAVGGPAIELWQAPALDFTLAPEVQTPLAIHKSMEIYRAAQAAGQVQSQVTHLCNGD